MNARTVVVAGLYLLPALLFSVLAWQLWTYRQVRRPGGRLFRLLPIATAVLGAHYFVLMGRALVPGAIPRDPMAQVLTPWIAELEVSWLLSLALLRHILELTPLPERRPSALWLAGNYGLAVGGILLSLGLRFAPGTSEAMHRAAHDVFHVFYGILGMRCFVQFRRTARPGAWGPEAAGEMRGPDVALVRGGLVTAVVASAVGWLTVGGDLAVTAFEVCVGLAIAAPITLRLLGHVVPDLAVVTTLAGAAALLVLGYTVGLERIDPSFRPLLGAVVVVATVGLFTAGQALVRGVVTRLVLGRRLRRDQELQAFLQALSPDLGVVECARRMLEELVRVWQVPGAAILFADGATLVAGRFDASPLERVWPRGPAAAGLPAGGYGTAEIRQLPVELRDALVVARVGLGAAAVRSQRRHWGHLFVQAGFLGGTFREDDAEAFEALVDQLALLLDGADLLARTVAVERSLAHAEKLAAIGELAARFAHDIRNPVTAARSLAQQLARDPTAPANAEHAGIILGELERVERQVRDLLRFARREELVLEPVDLGALVRATTRDLAGRVAEAHVALELDTPDGIVARADREKLRHVLVNLVENALDAVGNGTGGACVGVAVGADDGAATIRVTDDGPGIPSEAQGRIFEPFVSLKPSGTGLGLAIAKRTVEAHGGTIAVESRPGATSFLVRLPAVAR